MYDYICSAAAELVQHACKALPTMVTELSYVGLQKKQDNLSIALPNLTLNYVQMNTYTSVVNILS